MRRLASKKERERKAKRNQIILGLILVFLMFISVLGYGFLGTDHSEDTNKLSLNGYDFIYDQGIWTTELNGGKFSLITNPSEITPLNTTLDSLGKYYNQVLYYSFEGLDTGGTLLSNLYPYVQRIQEACVEGQECLDSTLPLKNCSKDRIIILKNSSSSSIKQEENCLIISTPESNLDEISDAVSLRIFGIN